MMERDAAEFHEASYVQDMTTSDRPDDIIRDAVSSVWTGSPPATKTGFEAQCTAAAIAILRTLRESGNLAALMPDGGNESTMMLRGILLEIVRANNPAMVAHCAAFALDLGIIDESQTEIAKRFGVTRATVSYVCRNIVETYRNGNPARAMKSTEAVKKYSRLRKGKCAKQSAPPWEFAGTFKTSYQNANT